MTAPLSTRPSRDRMAARNRQAIAWPVVWDRVTMVLVLAAAAILVWPVRSDLPRTTNDTAPSGDSIVGGTAEPPSAHAVARVDSVVARTIGGNVFSASRAAPTTAFVMPGQSLAPTMLNGNVADSVMVPGSLASDSLPRLSGIVSTGGERRALVQFSDRDGAPRLYRVGEGASGFRIQRIGVDAVVLSSRTGVRTLRLLPPSARDSAGVPQ
jgi:hypothetical protein